MSLKSMAGAFALIGSLGVSQAGAEERKLGPEFNQQTPRAAIPIDCDLMGPNGEETDAFVRQYAIPRHIRGKSLAEAKDHMRRNHGITQDVFDRGRELCNEHFPERR